MATIHLKCDVCGNRYFEDEIYKEDGKKRIELVCYMCSNRRNFDFNFYTRRIIEIALKRKMISGDKKKLIANFRYQYASRW